MCMLPFLTLAMLHTDYLLSYNVLTLDYRLIVFLNQDKQRKEGMKLRVTRSGMEVLVFSTAIYITLLLVYDYGDGLFDS